MSIADAIYTRLDHPWCAQILDQYGLPIRRTDSLQTLRNRSRRLQEQSSLAQGLIDRSTENVIGPRIDVRPKSDSNEFNKEVADYWADATAGKMMDVRRSFSYGELLRLAYRAKKGDGDCGFILLDRMDQGMRWPELQLIVGEQIESPSFSTGGTRRIYDGVELNDANAAVAYWIKSGNSHVRIEARDFVFLLNTRTYNTVRGLPEFHGTYRLFDQLEGHIEAVVVAARIAACQAIVAKRKGGSGKISKFNQAAAADGKIVPARIIEPGMINFIDTDEDWSGFTPQQPHQDFVGFITTVARVLGVKWGLTVERVLLDFSKATYATSRSTTLQEMQTAEPEQESMASGFLQRFYPFWISKLIQYKRIKAKIPANPWAFEWIPKGRPLNDASKEVPGIRAAIAAGLEAPEYVATAMGYNWPQLLDTLARNKEQLEAIGLSLSLETAKPASGTSTSNDGKQPAAGTQEDNPDDGPTDDNPDDEKGTPPNEP